MKYADRLALHWALMWGLLGMFAYTGEWRFLIAMLLPTVVYFMYIFMGDK